jgi:hypothetical protein
VRNRILYVLLFFAVIILLAAWVISTLAIFGQQRIVRDLGVAAINIISVLIAVFVGVGLVYNDLDKKTIYTIVSKPISRWQFLAGKYAGLMLTICVNIVFMTFFFLSVLYFREYTSDDAITQALFMNEDGHPKLAEEIGAFDAPAYYLKSLFLSLGQGLLTTLTFGYYTTEATTGVMAASMLTMLEMAIVTAFAILFSSFSSPVLSAFMTLIVFLIGRSNEDLWYFAEMMAFKAGGYDQLSGGQVLAYWLSKGSAMVTPNLELFNQRGAIAQMQPVVVDAYSVGYGAAYAVCVLVVAAIVFNRRNFK